jgi:hypothetical protein
MVGGNGQCAGWHGHRAFGRAAERHIPLAPRSVDALVASRVALIVELLPPLVCQLKSWSLHNLRLGRRFKE